MFQYATARAISWRRGVPLLLDLTPLDNYSLHQGYQLSNIFEIDAKVACESDISEILGWRSSRLLRRALLHPSLKLFRGSHYVVEDDMSYWSGIANVGDTCYLHGYWQSDRYFQDCADFIRDQFCFKTELSEKNREISEIMKNVSGVCVHIRRGDYLANPVNLAKHGLCSIGYYSRAIRVVEKLVKSPYFFVFSDDPDWAKENVVINSPHLFVTCNYGQQSYVDMQLMSLCKHHIISNSSFSWWGAWLGHSNSQIVIAPDPWYEIPEFNSRDLLPADWIRMSKN